MNRTTGKAIVLGDDVDTDAILAVKYLARPDPKYWAGHALEMVRPDFAATAKAGDVIVAGTEFGSGSSREHAPIALREAGIRAIVARSCYRIFYRNAFNNGLPVLEVDDGLEKIVDGDAVEVDFVTGKIVDTTRGLTFQAKPIPRFLLDMTAAGGLVPWLTRTGGWSLEGSARA